MNDSDPGPSNSQSSKFGFRARRRNLTLMALLIISGVIVWGYASTLLSVSNVATIQTGATLIATGAVTHETCSASTGTYTSSLTVDWGNVATGSTQSRFICLENIGTGDYLVSVASDLPPGDGSISSPQIGQTIAIASFLLVEIDWNVSPRATLGAVTFNVTFQ